LFPFPLAVTVGASRQLQLFLAAFHIAGAAAILLAALDPLSQWAGMILLCCSLAFYSRPAQKVRLRGDREGKLEIWQGKKWVEARLAESSVVLPGCTVMRLGFESRRRQHSLVVLPDSLPAEDYRRLRVWLRWRGSKLTAKKKAVVITDQ
jgi:toxin CptA